MDFRVIKVLEGCESWNKELRVWNRSKLFARFQIGTYESIFSYTPYETTPYLCIRDLYKSPMIWITPSAVRSIKIASRINIVVEL